MQKRMLLVAVALAGVGAEHARAVDQTITPYGRWDRESTYTPPSPTVTSPALRLTAQTNPLPELTAENTQTWVWTPNTTGFSGGSMDVRAVFHRSAATLTVYTYNVGRVSGDIRGWGTVNADVYGLGYKSLLGNATKETHVGQEQAWIPTGMAGGIPVTARVNAISPPPGSEDPWRIISKTRVSIQRDHNIPPYVPSPSARAWVDFTQFTVHASAVDLLNPPTP